MEPRRRPSPPFWREPATGMVLHRMVRHAASGRRRRTGGGDRGVARDYRAPPDGPWPDPERGRARSPASLLSLRRVVEPPGRVRGGAGAALSVVSRREPARRGRAPRAHPGPDPGDRSGSARTARSPLSGVSHDVGAPARGHCTAGDRAALSECPGCRQRPAARAVASRGASEFRRARRPAPARPPPCRPALAGGHAHPGAAAERRA